MEKLTQLIMTIGTLDKEDVALLVVGLALFVVAVLVARGRVTHPRIAPPRPASGGAAARCGLDSRAAGVLPPRPRPGSAPDRAPDRRSCAASVRSGACPALRRDRGFRDHGARSRSHRRSRATWRAARGPGATAAVGTSARKRSSRGRARPGRAVAAAAHDRDARRFRPPSGWHWARRRRLRSPWSPPARRLRPS